jgi:hypothetical protein
MIRILWVEDGPLHLASPYEVIDRIDSGAIQAVQAEGYLDALDEIVKPDLHERFDAIVLDAHLPASSIDGAKLEVNHPDTFAQYALTLKQWYDGADASRPAPEQFKLEAGYLLFRDLVLAHGFPAERIVFLSGHLPHLETLLDNLKAAKIALRMYSKNAVHTRAAIAADDEFTTHVTQWEADEDVQLRRCVIDTTRDIETMIAESTAIPFFDFLRPRPDDMDDYRDQLRTYLASLRHGLPLLPHSAGGRANVLRGFVQALTAPWENRASGGHLDPDMRYNDLRVMRAGADTLKALRNRLAHNQVDGAFTPTGAQLMFLLAMGLMFGHQAVEGRIPPEDQPFDLAGTMECLRLEFTDVMRQCEDAGTDVDAVERSPRPGQSKSEAGAPRRLLFYGACLELLANEHGRRSTALQLTRMLWHNLFPRTVAAGGASDPGKIGAHHGKVTDADSLSRLSRDPAWGWLAALLRWEAGRCFAEAVQL